MPATLTRRRYLFPCTGYVSSVKKNLAPLSAITADSRDVILSPADGILLARLGSSVIGDSRHAPAGLLESKWSARARQIIAHKSDSLTDGYPTHAALLTTESLGSNYGTVYVRSTNSGGNNYQLGEEFGNVHYSLTNGANIHWKCIPLPYSCGTPTAGAMGMTRGSTSFLRRFFASGSRKLVRAGRWLFWTGLYGIAGAWEGRWNDSTITGTERNRVKPWGHIPPLHPPTLGSLPTPALTADRYNWSDGDMFYWSVIFEMEDGSYTMPWIPRPPEAGPPVITAARGGLNTIGTIRTTAGASMQYFATIPWTNIPRGPHGTVARILLRTNKVNVSVTTATTNTGGGAQPGPSGGGRSVQEIAPGKLLITARIPNNTQTTYNDPNGNDSSLLPDDRIIRFDHIWAPCARTAFEFDQRIAVGYTRVNPAAIIIAPTGANTPRDLNTDDDALTGSVYQSWRKSGGTFEMAKHSSPPSAGGFTQLTIGATTTLQQLVDMINETTTGGAAGEFAAQLVPGSDPNALASNLIDTYFTVGGCSASSATMTTSVTDGFQHVAVGMRAVGSGVPADTYVIAKASNTSITLSAAAASSSVSMLFGLDVGDNWLQFGVHVGFVRAFAPSLPSIIPFKASYLESLAKYEDKRNIWFTIGAPNNAAMAAQSFVQGNRRTVPADAGIFMGGAPIPKGAVLFYSNAIYTLENRRGGTTGEDFDFRVYPLNKKRGCIAWDSIVAGDGWAGGLTREGYVCTDGERERIISGDIWNPSTRTGDLDYELKQCAAAAAADTDGAHFHAAAIGHVLHITYRSSASVTYPDRRHLYDFSQGAEASGLNEVMRDIGGTESTARSYGWSAPLRQRVSVIGAVDRSDYTHTYGWVEANAGSVGDGRVDEIDMPGQLYDDAEVVSVSTTVTPGFTSASGSLGSVAVGAITPGGTDGVTTVASGTTVSSKSSDAAVVISAAPTGGTLPTAIALDWYGKEVEPVVYLAMDMGESLRERMSFQRATVLYKHTGTGATSMTLGFSRDKNRASATTLTLPAHTASDEWHQVVKELTQAARTPGRVGEFSWSHNGSGGARPELWGVEAEFELVDSQS